MSIDENRLLYLNQFQITTVLFVVLFFCLDVSGKEQMSTTLIH